MNQNQRLLSEGIAMALEDGTTAQEIAQQLNITTTEVLNMADNVRSRSINHDTKEHTMQFDSKILANAFNFKAQQAGRSYLKTKDRALKARGADQAELVAEAKQARDVFIRLVPFAPELILDDIVTEYCGLGREWNANGKMVTQFAEANGVDQQLAADLVGRQMTVAQDYAQATRGLKFGRYVSWLTDAAEEADPDNLPQDLEEIVLDAYNRAAQWNQPGDGLIIRDFANTMGIVECLPTWAECLQKNMPSAEQAMEARKRIGTRAAAAASAEQEAEQELTQTYGSF